MTRYIYILCLILLMSCGSQKETVTETPPPPRPGWVTGKPIDRAIYSGIGMAYKSAGADYIAIAKNNALNDLASEISVKISSSSLFYQIEKDDKLREEFQANTQLKSKENLEGYELENTYENENEYWVYYTLNRAYFNQLKHEREQNAIMLAKQLFANAKEFKENGQYAESLKFNVKAIAALKDFMADPLQEEIDGKMVFLHVELYTYLQNTLSDINLSPLQSKALVKRGRSLSGNDLSFVCLSPDGQPLAGIPIYLYYSGRRIPNNQLYTNTDGVVSYTLSRVTSKNQKEYLQANVNMVSLVSESTDDSFIRKLLAKLSGPEDRIEIAIQQASIYIEAEELNLGRKMPTNPLATAFKSEFLAEGFTVTAEKDKADFVLSIKAKTRVVQKSDRYATASLDAVIELRNGQNALAYNEAIQSFQGLQLTPEKAGEDAYKKLANEIEKRYFREMRRKVFD